MKTIVLAPDSFKGTLSSRQVCEEIAKAAGRVFPGCQVKSVPVADGGEGSVEAFLTAMGGERKELEVRGPFGEKMTGFYGLLEGGRTAIIEMAACAGLPLAEGRLDPERATTYGVGQLMVDAARSGCGKIILGLGGSCTNDGGCGAAAAAGARFFREDGEAFVPTGGTLGEIAGMDLTGLRRAFAGVEIVAMCDIDNPLYGEAGAAYIFGPQKGADPAMVERLDHNLRALEQVVKQALGVDLAPMPGAGRQGAWATAWPPFSGRSCSPASRPCWTPWASTGCWKGQTWCSAARAGWTPRVSGARWWLVWPAGPRPPVSPWWRWWGRSARASSPCMSWGSRRCSVSTGRPSLWRNPRPMRRKTSV